MLVHSYGIGLEAFIPNKVIMYGLTAVPTSEAFEKPLKVTDSSDLTWVLIRS